MSSTIRYQELQAVRTLWVWAVVGVITLFASFCFVYEIALGKQLAAEPTPAWVTWTIFISCGLVLPTLLLLFRLRTEVDEHELRITIFPWLEKRIPLHDVLSAKACRYHPLREFFGWGIRWVPGRGSAYSVDGNRGVRLELRSGKKILLGTRRPEALEAAITA